VRSGEFIAFPIAHGESGPRFEPIRFGNYAEIGCGC